MNRIDEPDWDPSSEEVCHNQRAAYDRMRESYPAAYSDLLGWSLFRHEDVFHVLQDPYTFSNAVSHYLSVPNGMDPPEHTHYRHLIEPYFSTERITAFEPTCKRIIESLLNNKHLPGTVEIMADLALPFAGQVQCAFLGWPEALNEPLIRWTKRNQHAIFIKDRDTLSEVAEEFKCFISNRLKERHNIITKSESDVTLELMREEVKERPINKEEITSILRNWTVGEIGTISAAISILVDYLANHAELQGQLRNQPQLLPAAIDEILRIYGPLATSRRVTTCPVEIGGRNIAAGERITLMWISANRDPRVFKDPNNFRWDRDPTKNLLYGAGVHLCPGAPLARMELRVIIEELLKYSTQIEPVSGKSPAHAVYPASGYSTLPVYLK